MIIRKNNLHVSLRLQNKPFNRRFSAKFIDFALTGMDKQMHTGMILVYLCHSRS